MALRAVRAAVPELVLITDVCLCQYTSHGHCGVLRDGAVDNDVTLELLAQTAVSHAASGADIVAPARHDGRAGGAIRGALDGEGLTDTAILAYSSKFASAFYGPFREAAHSAPAEGDRRGYQMDPANGNEALREVLLDLDEGADMVMVKPAMPYLDVIRRVREATLAPVAAYQVSGEYAMLTAAARGRPARRAGGGAGGADGDPARGRGHDHHVPRHAGRRVAVVGRPRTEAESERLFAEACRVIPGGVSSPVRAMRSVGRDHPLFAARGEGAWLVDVDGNRYIDWVLSWGPLIAGHAHPAVVEAVTRAAAGGTSFGAPTAREVELAQRVVEAVPLDRDGAVRVVGHRGDDERGAAGARVHGAVEGAQVRRRLPRPRGRAAGAGGLRAGDAGDPVDAGRAGGGDGRHADLRVQRPRRGARAGRPATATTWRA